MEMVQQWLSKTSTSSSFAMKFSDNPNSVRYISLKTSSFSWLTSYRVADLYDFGTAMFLTPQDSICIILPIIDFQS